MAVNIKLKHSSVDGKAPVASDLENGELALNVNANSPAAYIKDSAGNVVKLAGAGSVTDEASVKKVGDTMTGPLVLSGDPTADDQASNKKYVDDSFLDAGGDGKYAEVAGDNFTGNVTLGTDKIVLDATNGTAVFTLQTITGTPSQGTYVNAFGANRIAVNSGAAGTVFNVNDTGEVVTNDRLVCNAAGNKDDSADAFLVYKEDGTTTGASITAGGAASFAGDLDAGSGIFNNGKAKVFVSSGDAGLYIYDAADTSTPTAIVNKDGSSTFAGAVTMSSPSAGSSGIMAFGAYGSDSGSSTAAIFTDGSAKFGGGITEIFGTYGMKLNSPNGVGSNSVIAIDNLGNRQITLAADGSGTFTNYVQSGSVEAGGGGGNYFSSGEVAAYAPTGTSPVFRGWNAGTGGANELGVTILASGEATFTGRISITEQSSADNAFLIKDTLSNDAIAMYGNGNATFNGTVTATVVPPSDARFKENITPAKPQLADVVALGGILKNYDWNDQAPLNEEIRSQRQLGLIAQEAAEVCPAIVKDIHKTKQGAVITPEEIIPAVVEPAHTIPAVTKEVPNPRPTKKGETITVEVTPAQEVPEKVITPEQVIPATYETLDDSYKGISSEALIMKLIGAVAELSAEVTALKATKLTKK